MRKDILIINKWKAHARGAKKRGIEFKLSFDDWWGIWESSGHWNERGPNGYQMCRNGDEGPYEVGNVYIAHNTKNKKDAWDNGKISTPPIGAKLGKKYPTRPNNPNYNRGSQYTEEQRYQRQLAATRRFRSTQKEQAYV